MNSDLFVWIFLPGATEPVIAGRLTTSKGATGYLGRFVYGKSYLARRDAIPIDPVSLPLSEQEFVFTALSGIPGAIMDACPDKWGVRVIDRLEGKKDYPLGYILTNDPGRAGMLAFSSSPDEKPVELVSREFPLADIMKAAEAVETGEPVDRELLRALHPGTGGARPKCNIIDEDGVWIAKFSSIDDSSLISIPRLEHASMSLARACGVDAAETRITSIDGKDICLVKRFDREIVRKESSSIVSRIGYLSARSVFYADTQFDKSGSPSYGRLARWMTRYGCTSFEKHQLYRRMAFNVAIRNSDDHELNHGLIHVGEGRWTLSKAFDVLPVLQSHHIHQHALLIGENADGTVENLLSNAEAFGLTRDEASFIVQDVQLIIRDHWLDVMYEAGFGDESIRHIEHLFQPIPLARSKKLKP